MLKRLYVFYLMKNMLPPPCLFLSLRKIFYPFYSFYISNRVFGKIYSILVSENKQILRSD